MINKQVSLRPVITEKSFDKANRGWYSFILDKDLNKNQAKKIIENFFSVNVVKIKSVILKGKTKRSWKTKKQVKEQDRKKVVVKLAKDQKIEIFETGGQPPKQ